MLFIQKTKFVCIFCRERKNETEAVFRRGLNGFCRKCESDIMRTEGIDSFEGTRNINYVLSPLFYDGMTRESIQRYKFEGHKGYGEVFAHIIDRYVSSYMDLGDFDAVIPVPISRHRMNERGFNQSEILARSVSQRLHVPLKINMLKKVKENKRQSTLSVQERQKNVVGAYWADAWLTDKNVILVDDIFTTGSTMEECAKTIRKSGNGITVGVTLSIKKFHRQPIW